MKYSKTFTETRSHAEYNKYHFNPDRDFSKGQSQNMERPRIS